MNGQMFRLFSDISFDGDHVGLDGSDCGFGFFLLEKKTNWKKRDGLLWPMIFSVLLPHIAQQAGWISAEVGRQPWIVWKLLRTTDGVFDFN